MEPLVDARNGIKSLKRFLEKVSPNKATAKAEKWEIRTYYQQGPERVPETLALVPHKW